MNPDDMADLITVKEAMSKLGKGRTFLYSQIKKKVITKYKIGGNTYLRESELLKVVRACS
jgi:predicted DNA-binding transcriptional regulator AlpA